MIVLVTCKNYSDFLQHTIERMVHFAWRHDGYVVVVTSEDDTATHSLCGKHGILYNNSDLWTVDGTFNKGLVLAQACENYKNQWVLSLDADILLPVHVNVGTLEKGVLYGARRYMCPKRETFDDFMAGKDIQVTKDFDFLPFGTSNPAAVSGYFQLFWNDGVRVFRSYPDASEYDIDFALRFARREWLDFYVMHVGPNRVNWKGRVSEAW